MLVPVKIGRSPGPCMFICAALFHVPPPLQVRKTGSSLHIIMYRLHISLWWVDPATVTSVRSVESKSHVASITSPDVKVQR